MASGDWADMTSDFDDTIVGRGTTRSVVAPNGGGSKVFIFHSLADEVGAVGMHTAQSGFASMLGGGVIEFAIMRGYGAGTKGFAPFGFFGAQAADVANFAYLLGLSDEDPCHVILRKGPIEGGLPDSLPTLNTGLQPDGCNMARSTGTYAAGTWYHLQLVVAANGNGDVNVSVNENDLDQHPVTAPVWAPVAGMDLVTDDLSQHNTGSAPLIPVSGGVPNGTSRAGLAFYFKQKARWGAFDHFRLRRQNV